jgi:hypothetical protein
VRKVICDVCGLNEVRRSPEKLEVATAAAASAIRVRANLQFRLVNSSGVGVGRADVCSACAGTLAESLRIAHWGGAA